MDDRQKGANYKRHKILWELGQYIAADPATRFGGNRDMCIAVGGGAGGSFKPRLRLATGSAAMAHAVAKGDIEMAFINPSAMLTQAYRGVGIFDRPLPLRIVASYPSEDRFLIAIRASLGLRSLDDVKTARYPLKVSLREDPAHSAVVLVNQLLAQHGMSLAEIESWGGGISPAGPPGDKRRLAGIRDGSIDAVADEGLNSWFDVAIENGMVPLALGEKALVGLAALGWRRVPLGDGRFSHYGITHEDCIDFGGWPLYAAASLPEALAYEVCGAFSARRDEMPWEDGSFTDFAQIGRETVATPMDVPLHPGAERWYREQGIL
ncbi:MAG TPA: TAXI family TRAP transporter solute-binding subunit [Beijerinckiaceae bacterium]|nr:TAXI family TRAP transporter solute-binding subunit [Beijerinckiaceae bacterium]